MQCCSEHGSQRLRMSLIILSFFELSVLQRVVICPVCVYHSLPLPGRISTNGIPSAVTPVLNILSLCSNYDVATMRHGHAARQHTATSHPLRFHRRGPSTRLPCLPVCLSAYRAASSLHHTMSSLLHAERPGRPHPSGLPYAVCTPQLIIPRSSKLV